nr:PREDICTED: uncharacterized protein LOC108211678 isoform X2 [Daucus carota subsp. sativus]
MGKRRRRDESEEGESPTDSENRFLSDSPGVEDNPSESSGSSEKGVSPIEGEKVELLSEVVLAKRGPSSSGGDSDVPLSARVPKGKKLISEEVSSKNKRGVVSGKNVDRKDITGGSVVKRVSKGKEVVKHGQEGKKKKLRVPTKSCIGSAKGWLDIPEKFVMSPLDTRREDYFQVYGKECYREPGGAITSDAILSSQLRDLEYVNKPCEFRPEYLDVVKQAFQIPDDYEVRMPKEGEMIYHRGDDLWVGIPLEHFRAGLRLPMHRFFHTLVSDMRLGLGQLGPNSIRKICAFIARCTDLKLEPTLSLFWALHQLQASRGHKPLFELHWMGRPLGGVLVEGPSSNKGWHPEFLMFRGGDLGYLPWYRNPKGVTKVVKRTEEIKDHEVEKATLFVGEELKGMWNEAHFRNVMFLVSHNLLLKNIPMSTIDKARALYLARTRAIKKKEGEDASGTVAASAGSIKGGEAMAAPNAEVISARRASKRGSENAKEDRTPKKAKTVEKLPVQVLELSDEEKDAALLEELTRARGIPTEIGGFVSSGSGLVPHGPPASAAGVVGYSLAQFQAGRGWLGSPADGIAPLEALNIFSLSPDKERMAAEGDEELLGAAQEALGQLGTRVMGLVERTRQKMLLIKTERQDRNKERSSRREAEKTLGEVRKELETLQEESKRREADLSKAREDLEVEQGISESIRLEVERMSGLVVKKDEELQRAKEELRNITETLERTEKEVNITYQDCVEKYKKSQDFKDEVAAGAGSFHAIGFQDCLDFIGVGNMVDPEKHSVEKFQDLHLEGYEPDPVETGDEGFDPEAELALGRGVIGGVAEANPEGGPTLPEGGETNPKAQPEGGSSVHPQGDGSILPEKEV